MQAVEKRGQKMKGVNNHRLIQTIHHITYHTSVKVS